MPLILVENGAHKGRRFPLGAGGLFTIGRDQGVEIQLPDPMVSRRHSTIEVRDGAFILRDLGSANGTQLNGERVDERALKPGDRLLAGETLLTFLAEESADPLIGKTLKGYLVLERIGRGGMGTVYLSRQVSLERLVALKLLSQEMVEDPAFVSRFIDEARSAARLNHPNIVMVYDIDDAVMDGQRIVYYSMEHMAGGSVEDLLHRQGRLDAERALGIALATAQGLHYAERVGLVHRDIKPGNLMIHESGTIKIGDLGIAARSAGAGGKASQRGGVSGSPHYISPEQARGQDIDSRADIYSLGATLFQMLAGRPPFLGAEVRELLLKQVREPPPDLLALRPEVPAPVAALVARMLEKDRERRHPTARHLVEDIEETLARLHAPLPLHPARDARLARRVAVGAAVALLVLGLLGGTGLAVKGFRESRSRRKAAEVEHRQRLAEAEELFLGGNFEEAEGVLSALDPIPLLEKEFPEVAGEASRLRRRIGEERSAREKERREEEAMAAFEAIRAGMPDLGAVETVKDLEGLLPPLRALEVEWAGTAAAREAAAEEARVRQAMRDLAARMARGQDALRSLLITAETFLESQPPRYREALALLRDPPPTLKDTPAEKDLARRLAEITARMVSDARSQAAEAEKAASGGQAEEAIRKLEKLRDRMDGEALSIIDSALKTLRKTR